MNVFIRPHMLFVTILLALLFCRINGEANLKSMDHFPESIMGWELKDKPETYEGDDLFLYINGGADIYHEYGFKRVTSGEYEKKGAGRISVEIYNMDDPHSAFGIFSFRTGGKWKESISGNLYFHEEYYQNILIGSHLITITSIDINKETGKGIPEFRKVFEKRISGLIAIPQPIRFLKRNKYEKRIYFEGDLGMMNIFNLASSETGISNGAAGINKNNITLILNFREGKSIRGNYTHLIDILKGEGRYSEFRTLDSMESFFDRAKRVLLLTIMKEYIVVYIGKNIEEGKKAIKKLSEQISLGR